MADQERTEPLDPKVIELQSEWLVRNRLHPRWMIAAEPDDTYSVHYHTVDGVAPPAVYVTRAEAAARVLQLLGLKEPVTPQDWPEEVCIGSINDRPVAGGNA